MAQETAPVEWSAPLALSSLTQGTPKHLKIDAGPDARAALVRRFAIPAVERAHAELSVVLGRGDRVRVTGRLSARVIQTCVVTTDPVASDLDLPVDMLLLAREDPALTDPDLDADPDGPDVDEHDGQTVDLGEIAAQTLALNLPDYPRSPGAALPDAAVSDVDGPDNPFAVLATLRGNREANGSDA